MLKKHPASFSNGQESKVESQSQAELKPGKLWIATSFQCLDVKIKILENALVAQSDKRLAKGEQVYENVHTKGRLVHIKWCKSHYNKTFQKSYEEKGCYPSNFQSGTYTAILFFQFPIWQIHSHFINPLAFSSQKHTIIL